MFVTSVPAPRHSDRFSISAIGKTTQHEPLSPSTDTDSSASDEEPEHDHRCSNTAKLCLCEVKRHTTTASCWLVVNQRVYDVTSLLDAHPGGARSLLRKAGGQDCDRDMKFHSSLARRMLEHYFVGKLQPCGEAVDEGDSNCSIM